jgi:hypothetical protein
MGKYCTCIKWLHLRNDHLHRKGNKVLNEWERPKHKVWEVRHGIEQIIKDPICFHDHDICKFGFARLVQRSLGY